MDAKEQIEHQKVEFKQAIEKALDVAGQHANAAEVAITKTTGLSVSTLGREVENVEFNSDGSLGITVYCGQRKGRSATSDLSEASIQQAVLAAIDIAAYTSEDPYSGLAPQSMMVQNPPDLDLFHPQNITPEQAAEHAIAAEHAALEFSPQIKQSDGASYDSYYGIHVYGNTHGVLQHYASSRHSLSCSVIGVDDNGEMERDYSFTVARHADQLWTPASVGQKAAEKTVSRLNPKQVKTGEYPVLFDASVATGLIGHFISAISGGSLYRKSSFLLDKLSHQLFPEWFAIHEDPYILQGLGSVPFDAEGLIVKPQQIVQQGILETYLLTSYAARKLNMTPTGHAGGIHNWFVHSSGENQQQLFEKMGTGLWITELMGQGVNIVTGDYSRGAAGFWIEDGKIKYPVAGITIAGHLSDMFMHIQAVGNDVETRSPIQTGSILIRSMKVAGE